MNPETQLQIPSVEQRPVSSDFAVEKTPDFFGKERDNKSIESYEQKSKNTAISSAVGLTTSLPAPVIDDVKVVDDTSITLNPIAAKNDDLIAKEWVDRAKKIVSETKDDPYQQEKEVNKLQKDYLQKRYGKEIGFAE